MPFRERIIRLFVYVTIILFIPTLSIAEPALWKLEGKKNSIYLFGSIHVANQSMYPLGAKVEAAFNNSEVLVVEVDEAKVDQVKVQEIMMSKGFYGGTETIKDHVTQDTFLSLQKMLNDTGIPYVTVARMKPGIIALTLTVAKIVKMGYSPELGIDRYFMNQARGKKEIRQLESMDEQMELILSFSEEDIMLKHTLVTLDKMDSMVQELMSSWKQGKIDTMYKLMIQDQIKEYPEFIPVFKRLITDRNITMTMKIQQMLDDKKNYFVVVGVGHLLGEEGIVELLRKKKITVKRQ